jgi:hypothetical protein
VSRLRHFHVVEDDYGEIARRPIDGDGNSTGRLLLAHERLRLRVLTRIAKTYIKANKANPRASKNSFHRLVTGRKPDALRAYDRAAQELTQADE